MFLFHLCMAVGLGRESAGRVAVCVLTKEGERDCCGARLGPASGGAVAGRGMARPLHDDDGGGGDDDELHRVPQAKITNWGVVAKWRRGR